MPPVADGLYPSKARKPSWMWDMVISAISQQADISFMEKEPEKESITITRWNTFDNDPETLQCSVPLPVHRR